MFWSLDGKLTDGEPSGWRLTGGIWFPECMLLGGWPVQHTGTAGDPRAGTAAAFCPPGTLPCRMTCGTVLRSPRSDCSAKAQAFPPSHGPRSPRTRMQWPDNTAPRPEQPTRQGPTWICCACGRRGRWHRCSRCLSARYCSVGCQAAHWPAHRQHCINRSSSPMGGSSSAASSASQCTTADSATASCPPTAGSHVQHAEAPARSVASSQANGSRTTTLPGTGLDDALPGAGH